MKFLTGSILGIFLFSLVGCGDDPKLYDGDLGSWELSEHPGDAREPSAHFVESGERLELEPGVYWLDIVELPVKQATLTIGDWSATVVAEQPGFLVRIPVGQFPVVQWPGEIGQGLVHVLAADFSTVFLGGGDDSCQGHESEWVLSVIGTEAFNIHVRPCVGGTMTVDIKDSTGRRVASNYGSASPKFNSVWFKVKIPGNALDANELFHSVWVSCDPGEDSTGSCMWRFSSGS